jgi:hypothetical protein
MFVFIFIFLYFLHPYPSVKVIKTVPASEKFITSLHLQWRHCRPREAKEMAIWSCKIEILPFPSHRDERMSTKTDSIHVLRVVYLSWPFFPTCVICSSKMRPGVQPAAAATLHKLHSVHHNFTRRIDVGVLFSRRY